MKRFFPAQPRRGTLLGTVVALTLAGCAFSPPLIPEGQEVTIAKTTFSFDKERIASDYLDAYKIAPGDELDVLFQIRSWVKKGDFKIAVDHTIDVKFVHAPELDQSQRVRPDGNITLPYIGDVYVVGKTVETLTAELKAQYGKILRIPQLYVLIPDFRSAIKELKTDLHTAPRGLSRLITVRPDGFVTFPMVGELHVAGRSIAAVGKELNSLYENYLPGLNCDLFLEKHTGSVIYVQGEVNKPGVFPIAKPISVVEALALAGSVTPSARLENVIVVRRQKDQLVATRVDVARSLDLSPERSLFILQPDDIVLVSKTKLSAVAEVMRNISSILMFRGWSGVNFSYDLNP